MAIQHVFLLSLAAFLILDQAIGQDIPVDDVEATTTTWLGTSTDSYWHRLSARMKEEGNSEYRDLKRWRPFYLYAHIFLDENGWWNSSQAWVYHTKTWGVYPTNCYAECPGQLTSFLVPLDPAMNQKECPSRMIKPSSRAFTRSSNYKAQCRHKQQTFCNYCVILNPATNRIYLPPVHYQVQSNLMGNVTYNAPPKDKCSTYTHLFNGTCTDYNAFQPNLGDNLFTFRP